MNVFFLDAIMTTDLLLVLPANAIQIEEHIQITAQLTKAVYSGAERSDNTFRKVSSSDVSEQRTDQKTKTDAVLCQLISLGQTLYLLIYLEHKL